MLFDKENYSKNVLYHKIVIELCKRFNYYFNFKYFNWL